MPNWKLYASSAVFVLLTVAKLLFPETTAHARAAVVRMIDMGMDYRGMAVQVGSLLTEESVQQVMGRLRGELQEAAAAVKETPLITPLPTEAPESTPDVTAPPTVLPTPEPTPGLTPEPTPEPASETEASGELQAVIEAFRLSQEAYRDYDTPETVSYEVTAIPFDYAAPVAGVTSSGFGYRVHPIQGQVLFHYGTDYAVEIGTAVTAFADGEVTMTGYEKGYGNYVQVTHADGWKSLYAHCDEVQVYWGQPVKKGDVIALSGETGTATGPHLHLELTHNGLYTNPEFYVS